MLNGTVWGQILHDLPIDVEKYLYLILRQVGIFVFVVELDRRVQQWFPYFLGVVLLAYFYSIVQNLLYFDVRGKILLVILVTSL